MSVSAAKVKAVCTSPEVALVRASRGSALAQLSHARVKQHALRARKLVTKWEGLVREQSRTRGRQTGSSAVDANTQLKADIFREALTAFEANLQKREQAVPTAVRASNTKRTRAAAHRTTRAAVRQDLATVKLQRNATAANKRKVVTAKKVKAAAVPVGGNQSAAKPATAQAAKPARKPAKAKSARAASGNVATSKPAPAKQLVAKTAAKQARLAQSGKAGRSLGHTLARGKRAQARRDAKN